MPDDMKEWMSVLENTRPMTEEEYEASGLVAVPPYQPEIEDEYVFDDGDDPFYSFNDNGVAFNGLVDGAGDFPLWENDSHK